MKNKKLLFGEARFVFEGNVPSRKPGTVSPSPTPSVPSRRAKARRTVEVTAGSRRDRITQRAKLERGAVKPTVDFTKLDLEGITFDLPFYVRNGKVEISPGNLAHFKGMFGTHFEKAKGLAALKQTLASDKKISLEDAGDMLESVYATYYLTQLQKTFQSKYQYLEEYVKKNGKGNFEVTGSIKRKSGGFDIAFKAKDGQLKGYDEWVKKYKPKARTATKKPPEKPKQVPDEERQGALARFRKTSIGKLFAAMKDEKGVSMLQKIEKNEAPMFILAILGLLGFKTLGGGVWEGIRDVAKGTQADGKLSAIEKRARASRFAAVGEEQRRIAKFLQNNSRQFGEFLTNAGDSGQDIPKKGLRLSQSFNFRGRAMKVIFGAGGRMVIPGPARILVNGNPTSVPKGRPRSYDASQGDKEVEIGGTLSKGTIFEGKVTLVYVSADKAKKPKYRATKPGKKIAPRKAA